MSERPNLNGRRGGGRFDGTGRDLDALLALRPFDIMFLGCRYPAQESSVVARMGVARVTNIQRLGLGLVLQGRWEASEMYGISHGRLLRNYEA